MSQPIDYHTPDNPLDFVNRKTGLMVAGSFMIAMGALAGCLAILTPAGLVLARNVGQPAQPLGGVIVGVGFYVLISVGLIWCGIGSIRARCWTRPLVLIFSTLAMATGVITLIGLIVLAPSMAQAMQATRPAGSPALPAGVATIGIVVGIAVTVVIYLAIPGVYFWFYRQDDVRRTLEYYDPQPRWTDRCPITVLGLSIICLISAIFMPFSAIYGVIPLFGHVFHGIAVLGISLVIMAVLIVAGVLVYRQRLAGWWLVVGMVGLFIVSSVLNVALVDFDAVYAAMGLPKEQLAIVRQNPVGNPRMMILWVSILSIAFLAYAIAIRKHFTAAPARDDLHGPGL